MSLKNLKAAAMARAMGFMQSDQGQKIMASAEVQKAMTWAFQTSFKVKHNLDSAKKNVARRFSVATADDLKELKRTLDRLERKVKKLNDVTKKAKD